MARPARPDPSDRSVSQPTSTDRIPGTVQRRVMDRGFGFILSQAGAEYFYHRNDLENCEFESCLEGSSVTFVPKTTPKGLRAEEVRIV